MPCLRATVVAMLTAAYIAGCHHTQPQPVPLAVTFAGGYGTFEAGGPFAGFESHHSRPLPSRLSFYAPVANSLDLSQDYWQRDLSQIFHLALQIDDGPRRELGWEPWNCELTPATLTFTQQQGHTGCTIAYRFCQNLPAMVARLVLRNHDRQARHYRFYTHWELSLRTCQSYRMKDRARTWYEPETQTIHAAFDDPETAHAVVLVGNTGVAPSRWTSQSAVLRREGSLTWIQSDGDEIWSDDTTGLPVQPAAAFLYEKHLQPGDSLVVEQFIASTTANEAGSVARQLRTHARQESEQYTSGIRHAADNVPRLQSGDRDLDHSARWAQALLAANRHYLDGAMVPMPCPAQYNFFFTHDALMTDLAAANFDAARVRHDLLYLAGKAGADSLIPHAYYWRDDGFETEYAGADNWNHFWFILVSASYLRHSGDLTLVRELWPLLEKSLALTLSHRGAEGLLWAASPDWWDIGHVPGPRAYMTVLASRALEDFIYLGSCLGLPAARLQDHVQQIRALRQALVQHLWDERLQYLISFNHGTQRDEHLYAGSLLAAVFDALPAELQRRLVTTAEQRLYDAQLGLRTVDPADFHLRESEYGFVSHEQGAPGAYLNGGIWPHCTAWYALALQHIGSVDQAMEVLRRNLTIAGIWHSPQGQPAMYEYRWSDPTTPAYGRVDKPAFLWAGGWYLLALYRLLGAAEQTWNLHLLTALPESTPAPAFDWLVNGQHVQVKYEGRGLHAASITCDGLAFPSLVVAEGMKPQRILVRRGAVRQPYLAGLTAILREVRAAPEEHGLHLRTRAFAGHESVATIVSPRLPRQVQVDGALLAGGAWQAKPLAGGGYETQVSYTHAAAEAEVSVTFGD